MTPEQNKAFIRAYIEATSGKPKTPALIERFIEDPYLKNHILRMEAAFPEYEYIPKDIIAEGDKVVVRFTFQGLHQGEILGRPPSFKKIKTSVIVIYQVTDFKIVRHWMQTDTNDFRLQIGAVEQRIL